MNSPESLCQVEIYVRDLAASFRFYGNVFGWRRTEAELHGCIIFEVSEKSGFGVSLVEVAGEIRKADSPVLYFRVEDPESLVEKVSLVGGDFLAGPKKVLPYGKVWFIRDPDGHRLGLFQPL